MILKLGGIIPADCVLLPVLFISFEEILNRQGTGLKVDQSSLTGESLPVQKKLGDECYSGSIGKLEFF